MWHFNKLISSAVRHPPSPSTVWSLGPLIINANGISCRTPTSIYHLSSPSMCDPSALGVNMINGSSSASQLCFASFSIIVFVFLSFFLHLASRLLSALRFFCFSRCQWMALIVADRMPKERVNMNMNMEYEHDCDCNRECEWQCECPVWVSIAETTTTEQSS